MNSNVAVEDADAVVLLLRAFHVVEIQAAGAVEATFTSARDRLPRAPAKRARVKK